MLRLRRSSFFIKYLSAEFKRFCILRIVNERCLCAGHNQNQRNDIEELNNLNFNLKIKGSSFTLFSKLKGCARIYG